MLDKRKVLSHALDWFIQNLGESLAAGQTEHGQGAAVDTAQMLDDLGQVRSRTTALPIGVFELDDPRFPYELTAILAGMGSHRDAWRADAAKADEHKKYSTEVDAIVTLARALRASLQPRPSAAAPGRDSPSGCPRATSRT